MTVEFRDLEALAQQDFDLALFETIAAQASQYQNATPAEIYNLLEEVAQSYAALGPKLAITLQANAELEIAFLTFLYQAAVSKLHSSQTNAQQLQNIFQMLSCCV